MSNRILFDETWENSGQSLYITFSNLLLMSFHNTMDHCGGFTLSVKPVNIRSIIKRE
ncbi:MAG: hypothetical protein ACFFCC_12680 [Promethearchaeota archaeon]